MVRTSVTHSAAPRVPLFCSYHILTSSVIYYYSTNNFIDCQTDVIGVFEGCSNYGSPLLGNISLSVLRSQSDCAEAVLGASVQSFSVLVDVPVEHSMNGRSSSESSSITLDNFALLIRLTCTSSLFFSLERFDSAKPGV